MTTVVEFIPVRCPHCGAVMGRMIAKGDRIFLRAEDWEIAEGARDCPDCHRRFAFRPPKLGWDALVERWQSVNGKGVAQLIQESV